MHHNVLSIGNSETVISYAVGADRCGERLVRSRCRLIGRGSAQGDFTVTCQK